ncbi:PepSY domain-containing protein [Paenibacillaceae bacterium WGS1546]|uniref:PepSY domain-containing protein n=1 Tax=Cohnella sp. WGS1546 TaxID=3366810 RepID=UPI00372D3749
MKKRTKWIAATVAVFTAATIGASAASISSAAKIEPVATAGDNVAKPSETARTVAAIDIDEAIKLAEAAANGQARSAELERKRGVVYYDIEVVRDNREYDVHIDAHTGKTLKVELDDWDRDDRDRDDRDRDDGHRDGRKSGSVANDADRRAVSAEQAARIAADKVQGTVIKTELDEDDGVLIYEVDLRTNRGKVEVEVHAGTGKILSIDYDDDDDDDDDDD